MNVVTEPNSPCPVCREPVEGPVCSRCFLGAVAEEPPQAVKYTLHEKIGEGGMSEVHKARDNGLGRWVALKLLKNQTLRELERLRREAQTAAGLSHPNIAAVYETGELEGRPFIAMQYVDGPTLAGFPRDDTRRIVELLRDAARAVHHAHERGVIHRDIKPANLMTDASGRLFVLDFGLSKSLQVDEKISRTGEIMGTPAYMPPEQARGDLRRVDRRSDVYSIGATLYDLLTGVPPFTGKGLFEVLKRIQHEDPVSISSHAPRVPRDLQTVVMRCMEKEPARRYANAGEVADELDRFLRGEAVLAHPPSQFYRMRKYVARRKGIFAASAAGIVALTLSIVFLVPLLNRARSEAERRRVDAEEYEFHTSISRELDRLRMRFYKPGFRLHDEDFLEFERLEKRIRDRMTATRESGEGWHLVGRCRQFLGDDEGALDAWNLGLKTEPQHGGCLLQKGRSIFRQAMEVSWRDLEDADPDMLKQALALIGRAITSEGLPDIELDLARAYTLLIRREIEELNRFCDDVLENRAGEDFVEEFRILRAFQDLPRMIEETQLALDAQPSNYEAHYWRAVAYRQSTEDWMEHADTLLASAEKHFRLSVGIHPRFVEGHVGLATVLYQRGRRLLGRGRPKEARALFESAVQACDQAVLYRPNWDIPIVHRGAILVSLGDTEAAIRDFDRALDIRRTASTLHNRAVARERRGEYDQAIRDETEAIDLDPTFVPAWIGRGVAYSLSGDEGEAIANFSEAIRLAPENPDAWLSRGTSRFRRGDALAAIDDITKSLELRAGDPDAHFWRGMARQSIKRYAEAAEDFTGTIRANPRYPMAHFNRANMHYYRQDWAAAEKDYAQAALVDPNHADAFAYRGLCLLRLHQIEEGIRVLESALKVAPPGWRLDAPVRDWIRRARDR